MRMLGSRRREGEEVGWEGVGIRGRKKGGEEVEVLEEVLEWRWVISLFCLRLSN